MIENAIADTLNFQTTEDNPFTLECDCLIVGVHKGGDRPRVATVHPFAVNEVVQRFLDSCPSFTAEVGRCLLWYQAAGVKASTVLFVGLGEHDPMSIGDFIEVQNSIGVSLREHKWQSVVNATARLRVDGQDIYWNCRHSAAACTRALYRFRLPLSASSQDPLAVQTVLPITTGDDGERVRVAAAMGVSLGRGCNIARQLGNLPGNLCTPLKLAEAASEIAAPFATVEFKTHNRKDLERMQMNAMLAVAQGSSQEPVLIELHYRPKDVPAENPVFLIGKGITFDTGGISIKPSASMDEMKFDMSGAASVLGAFYAAADTGLQHPLSVLVPASENLPSGNAVKPGDVVKSASGQTIEILNTDAEGRLVLCDALHFAQQFSPRALIDVATLTGSCVVALGAHFSGLMSNDDALASALLKAGTESHDRCWRLPLDKDYDAQLRSNFADMANISDDRGGGTITAACFLQRFVKGPWAHLDIAGTAWKTGKEKGSTGRPVSLLYEYLLAL